MKEETTEYNEIELKFQVNFNPQIFLDAAKIIQPNLKTLIFKGVDQFYPVTEHTFIRHRKNDKGNELTIKKKTTQLDSVNRIEVDLLLDSDITNKDISKFLSSINSEWETPSFEIDKTSFVVYLEDVMLSYSIVNNKFNFLEIEPYKKASNTELKCVEIIGKYWKLLKELELDLGEPLSESLYEMFSPGGIYGVVA